MDAETVIQNYRNKALLSTPLYTDLGGGWNTRVSPPELKINQALVCRNIQFNAASGALTARDGTVKLLNTPFPLTVSAYGLYHAKFSGGNTLIVAPDAALYACIDGAWSAITGGSARIAPAKFRVSMALYNDMVIGFDGTNPPFKITRSGDVMANADLAGDPPSACRFVLIWNNYCFAAGDGTNKLYFSEASNPESWPGDNYIMVGGIGDGDEITGIGFSYGHLIVFKHNAIYAVSGASTSDFSLTKIAHNEGLVAPGCVVNAGNDLWFIGHNGVSFIGSDLRPTFVSDYVTYTYKADLAKLDFLTENIPAIGYNFKKNQIWVSTDSNGDGAHDRVYVHDLLNSDGSGRPAINEYLFFQGGGKNYTPKILAQYYEDSGAQSLISINSDGYVYKHDVPASEGGVGDDGNLVDWVLRTKFFNLGDPLRLKTPRYYQVFGASKEISSSATTRNHKYQSDTDSYAVLSSMNHARRGCFVETVDGKIYVIGGYDASGDGWLDVVEEYDPTTDAWIEKSPAPVPIAYGAAAADGAYIYIIGGTSSDQNARATLYRYHPATDTWDTLADMETARYFHHAAYYDGKIYVVGGQQSAVFKTNSLEAYDIAGGTWDTLTPHPGAGNILGTFTAIDGELFLIGGATFGNQGKKYTVSSDNWSDIAVIPEARMEAFAGNIGGKIHITGGYWNSAARRTSYLYDPVTDEWVQKTDIITDRYWGGSAVIGPDMYIIGGQGLASTFTLLYTDDFQSQTTVTADLTLNKRIPFPAAFSRRARYIAIELRAKISEGIQSITGWTMDYMMWQRRT